MIRIIFKDEISQNNDFAGKIKTSQRQIFANLLKKSKLAKINPREYLIWQKLISKVYLLKIVSRKENGRGYFD